jgi:hypothetical protein
LSRCGCNFLVVFGLAACLGCGPKQFPKVHLTGNVTVDGQPVAEGTINFQPQGKDQGPSTSAAIVGGKYEADAPRGPVKVFIQATKETGKIVDTAGSPHPERVNLIPARYHGGIDIDTADGKSQHDFPLVSDGR